MWSRGDNFIKNSTSFSDVGNVNAILGTVAENLYEKRGVVEETPVYSSSYVTNGTRKL